MAGSVRDLTPRRTDLRRAAAASCFLLLVVLALILPHAARATILEELTVEQLARRASMVVEGTVISSTGESTAGVVRTAVRLRVSQTLKGRPGAFATCYVPGGTLPDGSQVIVGEMPVFAPSDQCYVFVDVRGWVIGGYQGKLDVVRGRVTNGGVGTEAMSRRIKAALGVSRTSAQAAAVWIQGDVSDQHTMLKLAGVLVEARYGDGTGAVALTATTDANGFYKLNPLREKDPATGYNQTYDIRFTKAGYSSWHELVSASLFGSYCGAALDPLDAPPPAASPTITSITPAQASAGTDTHVTIRGTGFGTARGKVEFSYGRNGVMRISASDVVSWSDTAIDCAVPTGLIDKYPASAGTGPVVVSDALGRESNAYAFTVTFGYGGVKWATPSVTYYVNCLGVDAGERERLIDAGAAAWNAAGSGFSFVDGGATQAGAVNDGRNVITWGEGLPEGVIAATYRYDGGGAISQCDIAFSSSVSWSAGAAGSSTYDVQSTATHELGHWLALSDLYMIGDADEVMYGGVDKGQQRRSLGIGDVAGIHWIYPGGGSPVEPLTSTCAYRFARDARSDWHNASQSMTIRASGGTPPRAIHYSTDGGVTWKVSMSKSVVCLFSKDGSRQVLYYASDALGEEAQRHGGYINIDTVGPACFAQDAAVKRNQTCKILFTVYDETSPEVTMRVDITTASGKVKKRWTRGYGENFSGWWSTTYKCTLPRGVYDIRVYGSDLAENPQKVIGRAKLTVR
jgi:hypothetical protein